MGSLKAIVKRVVKDKDPTSTSFRQVSGSFLLGWMICKSMIISILYFGYILAAGGVNILDVRIRPVRDERALKHFV